MIRADGKTSWFSDSSVASGDNRTPGIAVANSHTLGGYWWVKMPNGRSPILKQIDWGPAGWTGRTVDVHSNAMHAVGYHGGNFPTDSRVQAVFLGRGRNHAARQAARMGLAVTPGGAVNGIAAPVARPTERPALSPQQVGIAGPTAAPAGLRAAMGGVPSTSLSPPPTTAQSGLEASLRRLKLI